MKIQENAMGRIRTTLNQINDGSTEKPPSQREISPQTKKLAEAVAMGVLAANQEMDRCR